MLKHISTLRVIAIPPIRTFSTTAAQCAERNVRAFPWLLHNDTPRIESYPYAHPGGSFSFLNILPTFIQHASSVRLASRTLHLNTGHSYFPEQFLLGATLATRRTLEVLSEHLSKPTEATRDSLENMLTPALIDRFERGKMQSLLPEDVVSISTPQIYDANLGDVWLTLGNPRAFAASSSREYEVTEWMTIKVGIKKAIMHNDERGDEESFGDSRTRVARGLIEGAQCKVDVKIDADVVYKVTNGNSKNNDGNDDEILMYDEGRRTLLVQFETPYFEPADKMVSSRDENGEPVNDWSWRISDIDQLLTKETLEGDEE